MFCEKLSDVKVLIDEGFRVDMTFSASADGSLIFFTAWGNGVYDMVVDGEHIIKT